MNCSLFNTSVFTLNIHTPDIFIMQFSLVYIFMRCFIKNKKLILKVSITTAADGIHTYFFHCFSEKIRLEISCESSARQRIHMKPQALFPTKDKSKKTKCCLLQFLFGTLRVKLFENEL